MTVFREHLGLYAQGFRLTVVLTALSFGAALVLGTAVAVARVGPVRPLRWAAATWVELVRNTPLAVLMVLFFFGFTKVGIRYSAFTSAVIVLSAYTSTFVAEVVRAGINAVPDGQVEAARSIGLRFGQVVGGVVLPQAFRAVVPPLGSVLSALIRNSSLASLLSVVELTEVADRITTETAQPVAAFLGVAVAYLCLTLPTGWLTGIVDRRWARAGT